MNRHIKVKLPVNLDITDSYVFKNIYYDLPPLKVLKLSDVIITKDGVCLKNFNILNESIYGIRDKISIYTLRSKLNLLDHDTFLMNGSNHYLLIHGPEFSYYSWLTESIPRLLMVKSRIKNLTLLLPKALKNVNFVRESLKLFSFKKTTYIPNKANLKVNLLVLPQIKPYPTLYYPKVVNDIRKLYSNYSKKNYELKKKLYEKLFLSNEVENKPEISNIKELLSLLNQYRINYLNIFTFPFYEQVQIMQNAKLIISTCGEDLACISFFKKGASILELIKTPVNEIDKPNLKYYNLASALEINYYYQFCTPMKNKQKKINSKIKVDLNLFEKNIKLILKYS
jgi:capsular polysaccharide biosynthesis protein